MELNDPAMKVLYAYTKALAVALDYRDQPTRLHSERVRDLSAAIAELLSLSTLLAARKRPQHCALPCHATAG
jgi:HD-GYP domain-containing protein (c-di-GMP phosphodiesterase class II)